jgi:hypothetical protein
MFAATHKFTKDNNRSINISNLGVLDRSESLTCLVLDYSATAPERSFASDFIQTGSAGSG